MGERAFAPPFTAVPTPAAEPRAVIGSKIRINGELSGEEDILIQGHVEGVITIKNHTLTIGRQGRVEADSRAAEIIVEGEVKGDLSGSEKVVIKASGNMTGNITAPRVSLDDGAEFKGMIDMSGSAPSVSGVATWSKPEE